MLTRGAGRCSSLAGLLHDVGKPETEFVNDKEEVHFYGHDAPGRPACRDDRDASV